ncbi:MAG: hypothetical protein WBE68_20365, partial [Candidatus Nitrosopolaris sp.]
MTSIQYAGKSFLVYIDYLAYRAYFFHKTFYDNVKYMLLILKFVRTTTSRILVPHDGSEMSDKAL